MRFKSDVLACPPPPSRFRGCLALAGATLARSCRGVGGTARDNRLFINAVCWILRTGAPWRDLPPDYGDWKHTHRRFCRWRDRGIWEGLLAQWVTEPDFEWLMIDASHIKVHPHAAGAQGGHQDMGRTQGGSTRSCLWTWMRMACRSEYLLHQAPQQIVHRLSHG
jgi:transposase